MIPSVYLIFYLLAVILLYLGHLETLEYKNNLINVMINAVVYEI